LPRPYAYGLCEHIDGNRFVSCLEFPITAKTVQVFQKSSWRLRGNTVAPARGSQVCRRIPAISALAAGSSKSPRTKLCSSQTRTKSCTLQL
jgi:hypothetical protein